MAPPPCHTRTQNKENSTPNEHSATGSGSESDEVQLSANMSPRSLYKAARQLQAKTQEYRQKCRDDKRKLADATNEELPGPRKKKRDDSPERDNDTDVVETIGKAFTIMNLFWITDHAKTFRTTVSEQYNPRERFETKANLIQGQLAEIWAALPAEYLDAIHGSKWLRKTFVDAMSQQRSNTAMRIRRQAGPSIFGCSLEVLLSPQARNEKFRAQVGWVEKDGGGFYDTWAVEILHNNYNGVFDLDCMFLNPVLMKIFAAIIHGPAAAISLSKGQSVAGSTNNETVAKIWSLTNTTPGAIATCAMLARWAVSLDERLQAHGANTGINWQSEFESYLRYLTLGLQERKASVLNIFRQWDKVLFPGTITSLSGRQTQITNNEDSTRDALAALKADATEVEDN